MSSSGKHGGGMLPPDGWVNVNTDQPVLNLPLPEPHVAVYSEGTIGNVSLDSVVVLRSVGLTEGSIQASGDNRVNLNLRLYFKGAYGVILADRTEIYVPTIEVPDHRRKVDDSSLWPNCEP
jgi:hypothetical protein